MNQEKRETAGSSQEGGVGGGGGGGGGGDGLQKKFLSPIWSKNKGGASPRSATVTIQQFFVSKCAFGPVKLPGLSRNGPWIILCEALCSSTKL